MRTNEQRIVCPVCKRILITSSIKYHVSSLSRLEKKGSYEGTRHIEFLKVLNKTK